MHGRPAQALLIGTFLFGALSIVAPFASAQVGSSAAPGRVYGSAEVDTHATFIDDGTRPRYPDALRPRAVNGRVLAQFVVDTNGIVDTASILTDEAGQPLFATAVREALASMHFTVATKARHRVSEEIMTSFVFKADDPPPVNIDSIFLATAKKSVATQPAVIAHGSLLPMYPEKARRTGFAAVVETEFEVDSSGHAEFGTFKVTSARSWRQFGASLRNFAKQVGPPDIDETSAAQAFVDAVRAALPLMRFVPATVNGHNARQRVSQPFTFSITH